MREREGEGEREERVNETDVIGLARSVKWWWQRQTLIVSSAQSSRQVICCGALGQERRRWRNRGDAEQGVLPFFLGRWKEVVEEEGEGIPGVRLTPNTLRPLSSRWKVVQHHLILLSSVSHCKY